MATFNGSLSSEVHYIVVEKLVADAKEAKYSNTRSIARETLLNLRLTSREFADLAIAKAVLFEKLEFQATKDSLTRLKQTNVASLAPFVKELSFLPTFYSATLSYWNFERLRLNFADHPKPWDTPMRNAVRKFVKEFGDGESHRVFPMTNDRDEMSETYEEYINRANMDHDLMLERSFHKVWLGCLQSFQRLTSIHLHTTLPEHPFIPIWPCTVAQWHDQFLCVKCIGSLDILKQDFESGGHFIFQTVVECMVRANTQLEVLGMDFELLITPGDQWQSPGWQLLSLDHLANLVICHSADALQGADSKANWKMCVETLFHKTHATLQHLKVTHTGYILQLDWPSMSPLSFPCLRHLELKGLWIEPVSFAADISHLGRLEQIAVVNTDINVADEANWKRVFDALRDHQPPLKCITFDTIGNESGDYWEIRVMEHKLRNADPGEESWSFTQHMENSLQRYLTKCGDWDDILDTWFYQHPDSETDV